MSKKDCINRSDKCWECNKKSYKYAYSGAFKEGVCDKCRLRLNKYNYEANPTNPFVKVFLKLVYARTFRNK